MLRLAERLLTPQEIRDPVAEGQMLHEQAMRKKGEKSMGKGNVFKELLAAAKAALALWDKHGLGDDHEESEPIYYRLKRAITAAESIEEGIEIESLIESVEALFSWLGSIASGQYEDAASPEVRGFCEGLSKNPLVTQVHERMAKLVD